MDKKAYVLKMLEILQNTRPLARWLSILVQSNEVDDTIIELLINTFQESIKGIENQAQKESLQKATTFLETLKAKESEDKKQDDLDIQKMETLLATM